MSEYTEPDVHDARFFLKDVRQQGYCNMYLKLHDHPDGTYSVECFSESENDGDPGVVAFTTWSEAQTYLKATNSRHLVVEELTLEERLEMFRFMYENNEARYLVILGTGRHQQELSGLDLSAEVPITFLFLDQLIKEGVVGKLDVDVKGKVDPGHTRIGKPT